MRKPRRSALARRLEFTAAASALVVAVASAAGDAVALPSAPILQAQVLELERTGVPSPVGIAFSPPGRAFHVIGAARGGSPAATDVVKLTPFALNSGSDRAGSARIAAAVRDPINMAFDARRGRLLLLLGNGAQLLEVRGLPNGDLDPARVRVHDLRRLNLQEPEGMTVDPATGDVFFLDAAQPRIVRVEPDAQGGLGGGAVSEIDLRPHGLSGVRGLAFDASSGHLHLRSGAKLYELTQLGEPVAFRDLSELDLVSPQGMVFAPSGDFTDDPAELSLYVADSGGGARQSSGQIVELSTTALPEAAADFTASLVNTVDMSTWDPPSPDPSGLAYLGDHLIMSDAEVDETVNGITHFEGANVWEFTLTGDVIRSANISKKAPTVVPMTNEPAGVAFKSSSRQYFFSEDTGKKVYTLNPGPDQLVGTSDDRWSSFATNVAPNDNGDPEGIAYDPVNDRLYVADGVNMEVYAYTVGGTLLGHFDVERYGIGDPETVEYNQANGTLLVVSNGASGPKIVEVTTGGALVQTIDLSTVYPPKSQGGRRPAGLALAPASDGSSFKHLYIVDRGIDNNIDPNAVDGHMFEFTSPFAEADAPPTVAITSPAEGATVAGTVSVTADATDDHGVTQVEFFLDGTTSLGVDTTAPYSVAWDTTAAADGAHSLTARATDTTSQQTTSAAVNVTVNNADAPPTVAITSPAEGATVAGTVSVTADATDDHGVTQVEFFLDGTTSLGVDTTAPYSVAWDTTAAADGAHSLTARATDTTSQQTTSAAVNVTVNNVSAPLYFSLQANGTVGGVAAANEDVVFFNGTSFSLAFDGSDVGLGKLRIDALAWLDSDSLLLSFDAAGTVSGIAVDDSDVVRFDASSLGPTTAGTFSLFFQGADVGLTTNGEDVDAFELLPNGHLLLSTEAAVSVTGASGVDEDLLEFAPTSLGTDTAGTFAMYFDGSDVGLNTTPGEDVDAAAVDASGKIYLSTVDLFSVQGVSGEDDDVFVFTPTSLGENTAGTFSSTLYFDGSAFGLTANDIFAIDLP